MFKLDLEKGRGTRDQIANIRWIIEKVREFQKNIYFCFIDYAKAFVWITTNCGKYTYKNPKSKIIPDEEFKAFPLRSDIRQGCPLTPPLFNIILEVVAKCTKTKKEVKCIQIGKEDTKLPLFADD